MKSNTPLKRAISITITVLTVLIFVLAVVVLGITIHARVRGKEPTFFGYSYSIVATGSMEPEIHVGDLITVKICDIDDVEVGDNAVYYSALLDANIIHKVIEKGEDEEGIYIITQGVANNTPDAPVHGAEFVGIGVSSSSFGKVIRFFARPLNWIFITIILVCLGVAVHMIQKLVLYAHEGDGEADGQESETQKKDENQS